MGSLQLLGVIAAIVIIIWFSFKKVSLAYTMCAATVIMALTSGLSLGESMQVIWSAFTDGTTIELAVTVFAIGVFSTVMKETGYLERMVQGLSSFLGNIKGAIMAVPALIGSMPVLGGAAVSAPLVDKLGDGLDLSPSIKAAVNLVFRHGMFFIFPLSPTLILVANLIGVSVGTLLSKLWPYGIAFWLGGYWFLLRNTGQAKAVHASPAKTQPCAGKSQAPASTDAVSQASRVKGFKEFLRYGAPLLAALVSSVIFKISLWISMFTGVILGTAMSYLEKRELPSASTVLKGANLPQVAAMFWIMAFKEYAALSPVFPALVNTASSHGISPAVLAVVFPLLFGYVSANHMTTSGVLIPILVPAGASPDAVLYLTTVIYGAGFLAYFTSPLHLCQVLTCQYYDVDLAQIYKTYWPVIGAIAAVMLAYAGIAANLI